MAPDVTVEAVPELLFALLEVAGALVAAGGTVVAETDALRIVGSDAVLGVWFAVFGAVLFLVSLQLARDAASRWRSAVIA